MKIIFLDIDGVIQGFSQKRFDDFDAKEILAQTSFKKEDLQSLKEVKVVQDTFPRTHSLDILYGYVGQINPVYKSLDKYDIAAVCCDWEKESVKLLEQLCNSTGAKIVISSDWRMSKTLEQIKLLFKIHGLNDFVIDMTIKDYRSHPPQIKEYLEAHTNIKKFAIFDDGFRTEFEKLFPTEFINHNRCFNEEHYIKAKSLLS